MSLNGSMNGSINGGSLNGSNHSRRGGWQAVEEETPPPSVRAPAPTTSVMDQVSTFIQGLTGATTSSSASPAANVTTPEGKKAGHEKRRSSVTTIPADLFSQEEFSVEELDKVHRFQSSASSRGQDSSSHRSNTQPDTSENTDYDDSREIAIVGISDDIGQKNETIARLKRHRCILIVLALLLLQLVFMLGGLLGKANKQYAASSAALEEQQQRGAQPGSGAGPSLPNTSDNTDSHSTDIPPVTSSAALDEHCGCATCTDAIWNLKAESHTCGERITYLHENYPLQFMTIQDACRRIAFEFPCVCGGCDPARCNWVPETPFEIPSTEWQPDASVITSLETAVQDSVTLPNLESAAMYCFPNAGSRTEYQLWGGMKVQVKEDPARKPCGPGNNMFDKSTVVVNSATDELTLKFQNGQASEVRVLLPNSDFYTYGNYGFSVKSILVKDSIGNVLSTQLPKELVLGIFTWDDTEDYATHQNYNHEVDIEISRWNCEDNSDVQFLVQPPGAPQQYRFFSGQAEATDLAQQLDHSVPHWYNFSWIPGRIDWSSTAGGGQAYTLTTEEALYKGVADYVQCMPGSRNVEVRLNLWNMLGSRQPVGLATTDYVEVVFDKFVFEPSDLTHLADGEFCSKSCQCGTSSRCLNAVCTPVR